MKLIRSMNGTITKKTLFINIDIIREQWHMAMRETYVYHVNLERVVIKLN